VNVLPSRGVRGVLEPYFGSPVLTISYLSKGKRIQGTTVASSKPGLMTTWPTGVGVGEGVAVEVEEVLNRSLEMEEDVEDSGDGEGVAVTVEKVLNRSLEMEEDVEDSAEGVGVEEVVLEMSLEMVDVRVLKTSLEAEVVRRREEEDNSDVEELVGLWLEVEDIVLKTSLEVDDVATDDNEAFELEELDVKIAESVGVDETSLVNVLVAELCDSGLAMQSPKPFWHVSAPQ
jgi:hypothetical protein